MSTFIHPTAVVSPQARLDEHCYIGPFCYIGARVQIGRHTRLEAYVSVGTAAEHRDYFAAEAGAVVIGENCTIREFCTVNGGTQSTTTLGSRIVMLRGSHIGHDAVLRDGANLSCNVMIGGHSIVGQGANLGLNAIIHQHRAIGAYAMVGMNSTVTRNMVPFLISFGTPARPQRVNRIGLQRAGVTDADLVIFENWFQTQEETGSMSALPHAFSKLMKQYLADCQSFHKPSARAA